MNDTHSPFDPQELRVLLEQLWQDDLDESAHARLEHWLAHSEAGRALYLELTSQHLAMRELLNPPTLGTASTPAPTARPTTQDEHSSSRRPNRTLLLSLTLLIAAGLLTTWSLLISRQDDTSLANSKRLTIPLTQSSGAEFFGERTPRAVLAGRDYVLTAGMIELTFPKGASAIIEAPAVFAVQDLEVLALRTGTCSVHAPDGAEGFRVVTPVSEVVDRGTRFGIRVDEAGQTLVKVLEGAADVYRPRQDGATPEVIHLSTEQSVKLSDAPSSPDTTTSGDQVVYRSELPDRVVRYAARGSTPQAGVSELTSIDVQRGGKLRTYAATDLIGIEVLSYRGADPLRRHNSAPFLFDVQGSTDPQQLLTSDLSLITGLVNPGGSLSPLSEDPVIAPGSGDITPGMAIRFTRPVINGPGPDIVIFDVQTYTNPPDGDAFHISPLKFAPGLRALTVRRFDITMRSLEALKLSRFGLMHTRTPVLSLEDLATQEFQITRSHLEFCGLAVGVDLSDLGYAAGAQVEELFLQDTLDDATCVDPVLIVGLPPINNENR